MEATNILVHFVKEFISDPNYDNYMKIVRYCDEYDWPCDGISALDGMACKECPIRMQYIDDSTGMSPSRIGGWCPLGVYAHDYQRAFKNQQGEILLQMIKLFAMIEQHP